MARSDPDRFFNGKEWFRRVPGGTFAPERPAASRAAEPSTTDETPQDGYRPRLGRAIKKSADDLGIDAGDLAGSISYETGGTFSDTIRGPTTRWGQHRGLIQMGEVQRRQHGYREDDSVEDKMEAVTRYLRAAGVKPGMGLKDIYSAINTGAPGNYGATDAASGGAPGTVADKVAGMGPHLAKGRSLLDEAGVGSRVQRPSATPQDGGGSTSTPGSEASATTPGSGLSDGDPPEVRRGSANHMHGQYGAPGENLVRIRSRSGMTTLVHRDAATSFQGFVDELEASGYRIKSLGGHNHRVIRGGSRLSQHAYGNAIDINPGQNPMGRRLVTDLPANVSDMAAKHGLTWGGDWKRRKDAMHFEWAGKKPGQDEPSETRLAGGKAGTATRRPRTATPSQSPGDAKGRTRVAATTPGSGQPAQDGSEAGERSRVAGSRARPSAPDPGAVAAQARQAARSAAAETILSASSAPTPAPPPGAVGAPYLERVGRSLDGAMQSLQLAALQETTLATASLGRTSFLDT